VTRRLNGQIALDLEMLNAGGAGLCPAGAYAVAGFRRTEKEGAHGGTMGFPMVDDVDRLYRSLLEAA
jgi:hypothetical protein